MNNRPGGHALPARPNFASQATAPAPAPGASSAAGPSRPRPPLQQTRPQHHLPANPVQTYQPPINLSGGYSAQPHSYGYPQTGAYPAQPQLNLSGGYPVQQTFYSGQLQTPAPTFGQSLFQQSQPYTAGGYAYSSTYLQPSASTSTSAQPPAKRARPNADVPQAQAVEGAQAWRNCSHPGCKFVGPGNEVEIHEGDRHLIFPRGKPVERSEEEERFARRKGPIPPIQGTNIKLDTPEDIEKWIAERKAKWPSAKRVQEKDEERKAAIARGEIPARGRGRGRGRGGMNGGRMDAASIAEEWGRPPRDPAAVTDGSEREGRGERGRGRGRERGRGRGRGGIHGSERGGDQGWSRAETEPASLAAGEIRDEKVDGVPQAQPSAQGAPSGLAGLTGYDTPSTSGESESETSSDSSSSSSDSDSDSDSDNNKDGNEGETDKVPVTMGKVDSAQSATTAQVDAVAVASQPRPTRPVCKFFAKNGRCKNGDKCRFAHASAADGAAENRPTGAARTDAIEKKAPRQPMTRRANPFERPSMLGSLLANPIENTISQLSQTIRFLVANDFLRGVELNPGDADKQVEEKNKVVELSQINHDGDHGNGTDHDDVTVPLITEVDSATDEIQVDALESS